MTKRRTYNGLSEAQSAGPPLNPMQKIEAERACLLHGNVRIEALSSNEEALMKIRNEDKGWFQIPCL